MGLWSLVVPLVVPLAFMGCSFMCLGRLFMGLTRAFMGLGRLFMGLGRAFMGLGRLFMGLGRAFMGHSFMGRSFMGRLFTIDESFHQHLYYLQLAHFHLLPTNNSHLPRLFLNLILL